MLEKIADCVRALSADAVQKAASGHPGLPLGCAEIGAVLYSEILRHDPQAPDWPNRDRFVLSAGHGSAFLYSLLHLCGYDISLDDLKNFRQLGSKTPGHPEHGLTPGVETSTGPLGQGLANAVGMALAEAMAAARYNRPGFPVVDHYTYVLAGDGDMMEGISSEAASLAGHLGLHKLIVIYDANNISIEGRTNLTFSEAVGDRFRAFGWRVWEVDGHNIPAITSTLQSARRHTNGPSLIIARTKIGRKSLKEDSAKAHGEPLGVKEVAALKDALGLPQEDFYVSGDIRHYFTAKQPVWTKARLEWELMFNSWSEQYPELRREWDASRRLELPANLAALLPAFEIGKEAATRDAGGSVLRVLAHHLPYLVGGSADLAPSTKTYLEGYASVQKNEYGGRNLHFGVREHAMGAILNGMALHGHFRVFGSTFLVFADYMRPAIRMAALMELPVIYVFTHDSFYVGEDGPTHQPVEQLASLRLIPNLQVIRPADAVETAAAWVAALERRDGPTALILTRQKLPVVTTCRPEEMRRGAYVLKETTDGLPLKIVLVATGSEVALALAAAEELAAGGTGVRVVSMPNREAFLAQEPAYREAVLPSGVKRLVIEAGHPSGWHTLLAPGDGVMGLERFGTSGKAEHLAEYFGFTPAKVAAMARSLIGA
ncbi:MAG TPA: transketolase [Firmicutes bacterium]|nr:transketolase [Bacillota bacterium]